MKRLGPAIGGDSARFLPTVDSVFRDFRDVSFRMPVVAAVFALAAATWGAIFARRGSLLVGCGLLLAWHTLWATNSGTPGSARSR